MFLENKYTKWYYLIIKRAKSREPPILYESHHIMPKSMGGDNSELNLVKLTPREHYICHWLLTKMTNGECRRKMTFALHTFFHFNKHRNLNFKSRQYEYHKKTFISACKQRIPHTKTDIFLFKHVETKEEFLGTINAFHNHTGMSRQDINWLVNHCIQPDDPKKLIKKWGIWIDSLQIFSYDKNRPPMALLALDKVVCEHCGKSSSVGNYKRWHGNRCKVVDDRGHHERTRQVAIINKN